jgi:pilus assembly protein CpaE
VTPDAVHRFLDLLKAGHENVVIDLPRHINSCSTAAFQQADLVLIVCQLLVPSIRNTKRYFDALLQMGVPHERLEVVVNRGDSRGGGRITVKDIEDTTKKPVYACVPNDYQFVARSLDFGRPIASLDRSSSVRTAIRKMARRITSDTPSDSKVQGDRRGILSRLLTK